MSEPSSAGSARPGVNLERAREEILTAAQPLPPYEDMVIGELSEDEDKRFMEIILDL